MMIKHSDVIKNKNTFYEINYVIIEQIMLIFRLNSVPSRTQQALPIQIVEYMKRWCERLVGNRTFSCK